MQSEIKILKYDEKETTQTQQQASKSVQSHELTQNNELKYADVAKMTPTCVVNENRMQGEHSNILALERKNSPVFLQCKLCPGIHPAYKCNAYKALPVHKRMDYVKEEKLCVKCLKSQHSGSCVDPKSNIPCPVCKDGSYHNSTLCDKKANKQHDEDWN